MTRMSKMRLGNLKEGSSCDWSAGPTGPADYHLLEVVMVGYFIYTSSRNGMQ